MGYKLFFQEKNVPTISSERVQDENKEVQDHSLLNWDSSMIIHLKSSQAVIQPQTHISPNPMASNQTACGEFSFLTEIYIFFIYIFYFQNSPYLDGQLFESILLEYLYFFIGRLIYSLFFIYILWTQDRVGAKVDLQYIFGN